MSSAVILLVWIVVVAAAHGLITRPWKSVAARAPLAVIPATLMAAWVLGTGILSYHGAMAGGAWTAASVTLGLIPIKALILSLVAHAAGRAALKARETRMRSHWGLAAALGVFCVYAVGTDIDARHTAALERHAADEGLSSGELTALAEKARANDMAKGELGAFLGNRLCPEDLVMEAVASADPYRRTAAARNSALSAASADRLVDDPDEQVRYYLAFNAGLTPEQLARLARDKSAMVRGIVARRERLPDEAFAALADDPEASVRTVVALQPRISAGALEKLRQDPDARVRDAANRWAR